MEKKAKRTSGKAMGRLKARRDYTSMIVNPTIRKLINSHPKFAVLWLQLFDEFGIAPIMPSKLPANRRYKTTISMLKLMACDLAEQLDDIKLQSWAGRPAKVYRLLIPD